MNGSIVPVEGWGTRKVDGLTLSYWLFGWNVVQKLL